MDGDLIAIIIAVLVWVVPGLLGKMLKKAGKVITQPVTEMESDAEVESQLESMEEEDPFWSDVVEEEAETYPHVESPSASYFTYETVETPSKKKIEEPKSEKVMMVEEKSTEERYTFDLRQAIIYQTILQNDYISELK